ncbi:FecR domain-containing protein [Chitinophaga sedimenti]|uniref:FecR family protein n=1 Tax=Chitinophaga sedimenti TaxID=2033606 RepID=UPI0020064410|nr:FecR family protein [Chitinophaga sedimenti]MCK7556321.1 FecR domain-containing protein [Chitinophaga sedimenti]
MPQEDFSRIDIIAPLLHRQFIGETLTAAEQQLLDQWTNASEHNQSLAKRLQSPEAVQQMLTTWQAIDQHREINKQKVLARIAALSEETDNVRPLSIWRRKTLRYAAAAAIVLSAGWYIWSAQHPTPKPPLVLHEIIAPGREGAVLTLADGSTMVLDSVANGILTTQGGAQVMLQNGQLAYNTTGNNESITYNTIATPKGRQFKLLLPDGSKVWLNAASSVTFPTTFTGKERRVKLEGEAYFEIAQHAQQPFIVNIGETAEVEVLGTSFNINSYKNEASIKATLLQGAIRLYAYQQSAVLKPGQQAELTTSKAQLSLIQHPDLDKVIAWKNGLFNFDGASLEEVMRELERWYDIDVTYMNGVPAARFGGEINKQNSLQEVLQILQGSNVHFRLEEGRRLVVMP